MLESSKYQLETSGNYNFAIVLVVLEYPSGEKYYLSTNNLTFDGNHYAPLLDRSPSLSENINIRTKKYTISNTKLYISNYKYEDKYFTDRLHDLGGNYIVGGTCKIYYKTQGANNIGDCLLVYNGEIVNIKYNDKTCVLSLEDFSQKFFHRDIPVAKLGGGAEILEKYRNAPYPMVYGYIDRSPCIIGENNMLDENYRESLQVIAGNDENTQIINNMPSLVTNKADIPNYQYGIQPSNFKSYLMVYDGSYSSITDFTYNTAVGSIYLDETGSQPQGSPIFSIGEQTSNADGITNPPNIIYFKGSVVDGLPNLVAVGRAEAVHVGHVKETKYYYNDDDSEGSQYSPTAPLPFSGTAPISAMSANDWEGSYARKQGVKIQFMMTDPPLKYDYQWRNYTHSEWGFEQIAVNVVKFGYIDCNVAFENVLGNWYYTMFEYGHGKIGKWGYEDFTGRARYWGDYFSLYGDEYLGTLTSQEYDLSGYTGIRAMPISGSNPATDSNIRGMSLYGHYWNEGQPDNPWTASTADVTSLSITPKEVSIYHVDNILELDYFASVQGRYGINNSLSPASVIIDIIEKEVLGGDTLTYNSDELLMAETYHSGWLYAFSQTERGNSKDVIEGITKESKSFIYFNNQGEFSFITIKDVYEIETYNDNSVTMTDDSKAYKIDETDIIKYTFSRTPISQIITKIEILYNRDYGSGNHTGTTSESSIEQTAVDLYIDYSNTYYGISPTDDTDDYTHREQGDSPRAINYIREKDTADKLHLHLLAYYCNQHNIIKLRLNLKYAIYEIGDTVYFRELINNQKAFGEDYSLNKRVLLNEKVIRNGQEIHPFFMITKTRKSLNHVDIEAIQLHNLTNVETEAVNLAPTAMVVFELTDDGLNTPPDVYDASASGTPSITLDGTGSTDPEDGDLTYEWIYDTDLWSPVVGDNDTAEVELEFVGTLPNDTQDPQVHIFKLKVSDGTYSHISNPVRVYIINSNVPIITVEQDYLAGWQFVSLPVNPVSDFYLDLFPEATPGSCYQFTGTYTPATSLEVGKGYWLNFTNACTVTFVGYYIDSVQVYLPHSGSGWNLIGGLSGENLPIDDPDGIIVSNSLYEYTDTYIPVEFLDPGKGYWIRNTESGTVIINNA